MPSESPFCARSLGVSLPPAVSGYDPLRRVMRFVALPHNPGQGLEICVSGYGQMEHFRESAAGWDAQPRGRDRPRKASLKMHRTSTASPGDRRRIAAGVPGHNRGVQRTKDPAAPSPEQDGAMGPVEGMPTTNPSPDYSRSARVRSGGGSEGQRKRAGGDGGEVRA